MPEFALCVVDVQNGFVKPASAHIPEMASKAVSKFQALGAPVFVTKYFNEDSALYKTTMGWNRLQGSPETDLHPDFVFDERAVYVLDKRFYTGLTDEVLVEMDRLGIKVLFLCGIATESCVLKSAMDAFDHSIAPIVITDATASHANERLHQAGMDILRQNIGPSGLVRLDEVDAVLSALDFDALPGGITEKTGKLVHPELAEGISQ